MGLLLAGVWRQRLLERNALNLSHDKQSWSVIMQELLLSGQCRMVGFKKSEFDKIGNNKRIAAVPT